MKGDGACPVGDSIRTLTKGRKGSFPAGGPEGPYMRIVAAIEVFADVYLDVPHNLAEPPKMPCCH